jgi:hypothetical protein
VVGTAFLSACGGSSEPTAAERKAAKNRWIQRVDAACEKANEAIADRGWPTDLVDLDRLVVRGIDDAQAAIHTITGLAIPEGAGPNPGAFVKELKALEPELTKLSEASEDLEPAALVKAAEAIKPRLVTAEKAAEEAGVSDCLSRDERFFVPDAVRAPVFAEQLDKLDRSLLRRINRIDFAEASTPGEFAQAFDRYSEVIDTALKGHRHARPAAVGRAADRQLRRRLARPPVGDPEVHRAARTGQGKGALRAGSLQVPAGAEGPQRRGQRGDEDAPEDAARRRRGAHRPHASAGRGRRAGERRAVVSQANGGRAAAG